MTVLIIIGAGIAIYGSVLFIAWMNKFTTAVYRYEFFNKKSLTLTTIGYISLYFGYQWYLKAFKTDGDLLNGQLLLLVGALFILYIIWENIMATGWIAGILFSCIQLFLYVGISALLVMLIVSVAAAANRDRNGYYYDDRY